MRSWVKARLSSLTHSSHSSAAGPGASLPDRQSEGVALFGTTADMRHVKTPKQLTLDQWVDAIQTDCDWRAPRCPKCGAEGKWSYFKGALALDFECGSHTELVPEGDDYHIDFIGAYAGLVASCRPRAPIGDRHRLWRFAE